MLLSLLHARQLLRNAVLADTPYELPFFIVFIALRFSVCRLSGFTCMDPRVSTYCDFFSCCIAGWECST